MCFEGPARDRTRTALRGVIALHQGSASCYRPNWFVRRYTAQSAAALGRADGMLGCCAAAAPGATALAQRAMLVAMKTPTTHGVRATQCLRDDPALSPIECEITGSRSRCRLPALMGAAPIGGTSVAARAAAAMAVAAATAGPFAILRLVHL
jgi:hypothetical protein